MAATCGSTCSWTFSPQTRTRIGRGAASAADMVVLLSGWTTGGRAGLLDRAAVDAGRDVLLGEDEQDDGRDRGEHRGGHHCAPVGDIGAEVGVDAEGDRDDGALRGQRQGVDEVAPGEDEREE